MSKPIILVTGTYERPKRLEYLERCVRTFAGVGNVFWVVVEDGNCCSPEVEKILQASGIMHAYLCVGPTRDWGNTQRDLALKYIRDQRLEGIVYIADDDNGYEPVLFDEIRKTRRISIFPVGNLGPQRVEAPVVSQGRIVKWKGGWTGRKYPVDAGGFAFDSTLLHSLPDRIWQLTHRGGETEFLDSVISSADEFEPLCDQCTQCHVVHNMPLGTSVQAYLRKGRVRYRLRYILVDSIFGRLWRRCKALGKLWRDRVRAVWMSALRLSSSIVHGLR